MKLKEKMEKIMSKTVLKKVGATLVIGALIAGAGIWHYHQQKEIQKAKKSEARLALLQHQAEQQNIAILDAAKIRSITAETIGIDENSITFRKIDLKNVAQKEDKENNKQQGQLDKNLNVEQWFKPIYKVSCVVNDVKYKLKIDAITGKVLEAQV